MPATTAPAVTSRSQTKLLFFLVFFALTIFAAYEKNARILDPMSPIARHYAPAKWYLAVHAFFGILAMGHYTPALRKVPAEKLIRDVVGADGGPLIYNGSEEDQRSLDSTCRKLHRFLNQPQR